MGSRLSRWVVAFLVADRAVSSSPAQSSAKSDLPLLIVLLGPTASGKTALSIELAERLRGEVVSCDSVAVYRELEIGTAKPTRAERERTPHHMLDVAPPSEPYNAGDYSRAARIALAGIVERGHLPIVTAGTGLYLRALIEGLFAGPARSQTLRDRLQRAMARYGVGALHRILRRLDPASAALIHPNDQPKLIRAIEVCLASGSPMSQAWQSGRDALQGFRILRMGLEPERQALYGRINQRAEAMFREGLVVETEQLLARYGQDCRPLNSLGYKQAKAILDGTSTAADAIAAAQQAHRNFAKRQVTWFRREPDVHWLKGFGDETSVCEEAQRLIQAQRSAES